MQLVILDLSADMASSLFGLWRISEHNFVDACNNNVSRMIDKSEVTGTTIHVVEKMSQRSDSRYA